MVSKQYRISTDTLNPLFRASVGFDKLVNEFFNEPQFINNSTGYPPYNISKTKDILSIVDKEEVLSLRFICLSCACFITFAKVIIFSA